MAVSKESKVFFFSTDIQYRLRNIRKLKQFIELIFKKEKKELDFINYVFCSDNSLLDINRKYLNHDFYTDIVTFDLSSSKKKVAAEVYISIDRVRDNAKKLHVSITHEFHRVIFHGVLHLCGYEDKTHKGRIEMRKKEDLYLNTYLK